MGLSQPASISIYGETVQLYIALHSTFIIIERGVTTTPCFQLSTVRLLPLHPRGYGDHLNQLTPVCTCVFYMGMAVITVFMA